MKIFLASAIAIILSTSAFSIEKCSEISLQVFCEQSIRIADYRLQVYSHINPQNYVHGYWQGQKDAYESILELIEDE